MYTCNGLSAYTHLQEHAAAIALGAEALRQAQTQKATAAIQSQVTHAKQVRGLSDASKCKYSD